MASLSMPFLFRPIPLQQQYYGDGAMRQTSPLSPAIHLGANRLLVIGVGDPAVAGLGMRNPNAEPSFGQMFGFMLDSLFMDQLHSDLERINRYNEDPKVRRIDCLVLTPSQDLSEIARRHRRELPRSLRVLLRTMGANNSAGTATAELPVVRARLHARAHCAGTERCPRPRRGDPRVPRAARGHVFCSESCRVRTCG